ncbi:hypothetical protein FOL47_011210 [Perkinsus chesapeaki]|uniref:Uncharacterized protein n=1 Tax=Perkinsus chesapeaki TaxID=330153 RepID=A0A7J6MNX0_PERCH|nr:hypothetical protein FOL47_011210 [Perkinsus chesapeaki]
MTNRVFERLYHQAAEQRERLRQEREKWMAEQSRKEEETIKLPRRRRKASGDTFDRLYKGYALRQKHVDEQRAAQVEEFTEMAKPGGCPRDRKLDIEHINRLYEDFKGRQKAIAEAIVQQQKEIDNMANGELVGGRPKKPNAEVWEKLYQDQHRLSERRQAREEAAREEDRQRTHRTIGKLSRGRSLPTPRSLRVTKRMAKRGKHCSMASVDEEVKEKRLGQRTPLEADLQARVASLYKDAADRMERQRHRMERKELLELAEDIRATSTGTKRLASASGAAVHERLYRARFAPPSREFKAIAQEETWEEFNTRTCSVHASRQVTAEALNETFDRLYGDSAERRQRRDEERLSAEQRALELEAEASRRAVFRPVRQNGSSGSALWNKNQRERMYSNLDHRPAPLPGNRGHTGQKEGSASAALWLYDEGHSTLKALLRELDCD